MGPVKGHGPPILGLCGGSVGSGPELSLGEPPGQFPRSSPSRDLYVENHRFRQGNLNSVRAYGHSPFVDSDVYLDLVPFERH